MPLKSYDVVLIPEKVLAEKALALSKELSTMDTFFTLDNKTFFPHLSLYMLQMDEQGIKKACNLLADIANTTNSIRAIAKKYNYESAYFDIEYIKSDDLVSIQESVINALNPVRNGIREKDQERLLTAEGETKDNILKYGYRSVGTLFSPHLTFTRFKSNQENNLPTLPPIDSFNGTYMYLGIYELGDNGTCIKKVAEWSLR